MALSTVMLRRLVVGSFVVAKDTSPFLILHWYPIRSIAVRIIILSSRSNLLELLCFPFPIIFDLGCGQEVTPISMGKGTISLLIILQIILHG